jgi:tetratricopeptide (TPR) repeat protein
MPLFAKIMNIKKFNDFKHVLEKILSSKYFLGTIIILATAFVIHRPAYDFSEILSYADRGKMLLHGIKNTSISYSMPFINLLGAVTEYHSNINPQILLKLIFSLAIVGTYVLSYMIGLNSKGRITALLTLLIAGMYDNDFEQVIYSFLIILSAEMLILRSKNYNRKTSIIAGLAIGFTFFVRPALFLFPFVMVIFDYFHHSKNFKKYIINSIIFLSASFILLLPWVRVNHFLFNRFIPFEAERGSANIITSVQGLTFTMEGDARQLANLKKTDSVYKWAAKELLKNPMPALSAVPKRLLEIFYMHPFLILLGLIGLILGRKDKNVLLISIMAGYFIAIHSLFPIGERYFYPLKHLLAFPAACAFYFLFEKKEKASASRALPHIIFYAMLTIIIMIEIVLIAYPFRAKQELLAINNSLQKHPRDRWLLKKKGKILLLEEDKQKEGLQLLETARKINPDREKDLGYILNTLKAKTISEISIPPESQNTYELFLIKIAKELQLGEINTAKKSLLAAYTQWNKENFLLNPTSEKDFKMSKKIQKVGIDLYKSLNLQQALYWWPKQERIKIISNLGKITSIPEHLLLKQDKTSRHIANGDLLIEHISVILKFANKKSFHSNLKPLSLIDDIISDNIKTDTTTYLINTFHPNISRVKSAELQETIELIGNISDDAALFKQAKKISALYPNNVLYDFIKYRLATDALAKKQQRKIIKTSNNKISKNIYTLLKGSWHFTTQNKPEKAKELLKFAKRIKTKTVNETLEICLILQQLGEYKEALSILDKTIKSQVNNPKLYNARGVVLRFLKKEDLAIEDFKKALRVNPLFYPARLNLANLYLLSNNKNFARAHYLKITKQKNMPPEVIEMVNKELAEIPE